MPICKIIPPRGTVSHTLQAEVDALHDALHKDLCRVASLSLHARYVAIWQLSSLETFVVYHWLRAFSAIPVFLNNQWTVTDVKSVLARIPCSAIIVPLDGMTRQFNASHIHSVALAAPTYDMQSSVPIMRIARAKSVFPFYSATFASKSDVKSSAVIPTNLITDMNFSDSKFEGPAAIFFTSGTTSTPKAVPLSESNLLVQSNAKRDILHLDDNVRYVHLAPLYHVGGFSSAHATTNVGGTHIFPPATVHPSTTVGAIHLLNLISRTQVTLLVVVPTILCFLLDAYDGLSNPPLLSALRTVLYGGASLSCKLRQRVRDTWPTARLVGAYGMTETASSMTFLDHSSLPDTSPLHKSAGWPPPHVEMRIVPWDENGQHPDASSTADAESSASGEIWTRGPHLTTGYLGEQPFEKTTGWFPTGDFGFEDKATGAFFVQGRLHDVIKTGGEAVFAPEIEALLREHPAVADAAVVGVPHSVLGHAVAAAVELIGETVQRDIPVILSSVRQTCLVLASFKRPKWILHEHVLPRTATGKVVKPQVRQLLQRRIPTLAKL